MPAWLYVVGGVLAFAAGINWVMFVEECLLQRWRLSVTATVNLATWPMLACGALSVYCGVMAFGP